MKRLNSSVVSASLLLVGTVACATFAADAPVRVIRSSSDVANCQKIADVATPERTMDGDVLTAIAAAAREKGADTVLLEKGQHAGVAYRCEAPSVATK